MWPAARRSALDKDSKLEADLQIFAVWTFIAFSPHVDSCTSHCNSDCGDQGAKRCGLHTRTHRVNSVTLHIKILVKVNSMSSSRISFQNSRIEIVEGWERFQDRFEWSQIVWTMAPRNTLMPVMVVEACAAFCFNLFLWIHCSIAAIAAIAAAFAVTKISTCSLRNWGTSASARQEMPTFSLSWHSVFGSNEFKWEYAIKIY